MAIKGPPRLLLATSRMQEVMMVVIMIAMVILKKVSTGAGFWSIGLALFTVVAWHGASVMNVAPVFQYDPLWPGLAVSMVVFFAISLTGRKLK